MRMKFTWNSENVALPAIDYPAVEAWLAEVAGMHERSIGRLNYIFTDDPSMLDLNRRALGHDYFTDIITFDYSTPSIVAGDMYISLDTVASNAELVGATYMAELHRVIVHGLLHLCGIDDKGPGQREIMEHNENQALARLSKSALS